MNAVMFSQLAPAAALSLLAASPTMATKSTGAARNGVRPTMPVPPVRPLSMAAVMKAGAAGTGCSWSLAEDRRMRFAAADDRAVIHLASGIVRLRPADGAGDLFPFTYDRWTADGVTVTVTPIGPSSWKSVEVNEGAASIEVRTGRRRWIARGRLSCGS